jgi:peptidyl-prolyl cis-trans isomerase SurA
LPGSSPDLLPAIPDLPPVKMPVVPETGSPPESSAAKPALEGPPSSLPEPAGAKPPASATPLLVSDPAAAKPPAGTAPPSVPEAAPLSPPAGAAPEVPPAAPLAKPASSPAPAADAMPLESSPSPAAPPGPSAGAQQSKTGAAAGGPSGASAAPENADKSTDARDTAGAGKLATALPLESAPPSYSASPAATARATAPGPTKRDTQVVRTSAEQPKAEPTRRKQRSLEMTGRPIARVGKEIITYNDLIAATKENLQKVPELLAAYRDPGERAEARTYINRLGMETLQTLIDRTLLVQEAKRQVKDPKMLDQLYEAADKVFRDNEIAPLLRRFNLDSEQQLSERLAEKGRSLESMRQAFRQYFLAESYIHEKLKDHLKIELPELLKYYNERLEKHDFDRPAQITWREIVVEEAKYKSREEAQRKAANLLERLRRGEDFAKLAKAESDGLPSSRNQGGLMQTSPGGYGIAAVNQTLESMPIGRSSDVIAGPTSFHIVKVEGRRPPGPASFEEVQDQLRPILENKKYAEARAKYLAKLHRSTLITIYNLEKNAPSRDDTKTRGDGRGASAQNATLKTPAS